MTDYKYATKWLDYVSQSPPQEHGGFAPDTIVGATVSLRVMRKLKRENAQYRRWLLWIIAWAAGHGLMPVIFNEIRAKMPDLFRDGKRKPK